MSLVPLLIVTPVTVISHATTFGKGASVPTVNTLAWCTAGTGFVAFDPPPQLDSERIAKIAKNTPLVFEFRIATLLVSPIV
jgi:hypothetical protein